LLITVAKISEKLLYRFASAVVVNSPGYTRYLEQHGVPKWKIILIANGVDPCGFNPNDKGEEFRAEYGLANSFVVMYTGALGLANGVESLLQAACVLRHESGLKFVIVGDGKHKSKLERQARDLGLINVLFVPAQPKMRMPRILAAADVCVAVLANVPSLQITYPNKVFDYMAAGKPTVLAIQGPIREIIERSRGGVSVNPGDSSALAEAFLQLRRSPSLKTEMGLKARSYVEQYFNRAEQAKQFADLLERVVPLQAKNAPEPKRFHTEPAS
jgi:glycosyltransferase involved in cell wall biosynthesis